jgi:uncharacterized membrane protein YphA (DoxX/SURF4 family)
VNALLWGLQALLACAFLAAGGMHGAVPIATLATKMPWVADAPRWLPRFIGAMEVLGAVGLIVPMATRIAPWLTPLAAAGLAVMMLLATVMHLIRAELSNGVPSVVLFLLCSLVAFVRARHVA